MCVHVCVCLYMSVFLCVRVWMVWEGAREKFSKQERERVRERGRKRERESTREKQSGCVGACKYECVSIGFGGGVCL